MVAATFSFCKELNGFLPTERRRREFDAQCAQVATAKHVIETRGVTHAEVERVVVTDESRRVQKPERIFSAVQTALLPEVGERDSYVW